MIRTTLPPRYTQLTITTPQHPPAPPLSPTTPPNDEIVNHDIDTGEAEAGLYTPTHFNNPGSGQFEVMPAIPSSPVDNPLTPKHRNVDLAEGSDA